MLLVMPGAGVLVGVMIALTLDAARLQQELRAAPAHHPTALK